MSSHFPPPTSSLSPFSLSRAPPAREQHTEKVAKEGGREGRREEGRKKIDGEEDLKTPSTTKEKNAHFFTRRDSTSEKPFVHIKGNEGKGRVGDSRREGGRKGHADLCGITTARKWP